MREREPLIAVRLPRLMLEALDAAARVRPGGRRSYDGAASRSAIVREALMCFLNVDRFGQFLDRPGEDRD
jgi:hypothetical protein